ncbi:GTP cyclohydrolase I FolE [Sphingobacteriaceae bacterium]|nr:GTP cyclohydrolase I FolE [Sphingobacteriaceae bacterium]
MKQKETSLNTLAKGDIASLSDRDTERERAEEMGDNHVMTSVETPMKKDAFKLSDDEKMKKIEANFREIMETLGLDLRDDSLKGTPQRVAKMYVKEIFSGLNPANKPKIALFENTYQYNQMLVEKDITFYSNCEHHFVPIFGKAHLAYISNGKVIGLSKLNRIVQYFAKRPQVQERLTMQIAKELQDILETENVAIIIDAKHLCVSSRGVQDHNSATVTSFYGGKFQEEATKQEFLKYVEMKTHY